MAHRFEQKIALLNRIFSARARKTYRRLFQPRCAMRLSAALRELRGRRELRGELRGHPAEASARPFKEESVQQGRPRGALGAE